MNSSISERDLLINEENKYIRYFKSFNTEDLLNFKFKIVNKIDWDDINDFDRKLQLIKLNIIDNYIEEHQRVENSRQKISKIKHDNKMRMYLHKKKI